MRSRAPQTTLLLILLAGACSYSNQPDYPDGSTVPVEAVRVTPQVINLVAIGETRQLTVTVSPANASDKAVVWESTDSSVATISPEGVVTARAPGDGVFITAITHDGHHQASVNVSVTP